MRIIAGKRKGLVLKSPKDGRTRPTTDRVKENLFNIIQTSVRGTRVLDLFSGTGALGLEAMSRGAREAVLVERDRATYALLCENLHKVGDIGALKALHTDAFSFLDSDPRPFDLVFLDPPYHKGLGLQALDRLVDKNLLLPDALVVLETSRDECVPDRESERWKDLQQIRDVQYGTVRVRIYRNARNHENEEGPQKAKGG